MYSCAIISERSPINGLDVHPKLQNVLFPSTPVSTDCGAQRWPISCLSCGQTDGRPARRITFCLTLLRTGSGFRLSQVIESSLACSLCHHPWRAAKTLREIELNIFPDFASKLSFSISCTECDGGEGECVQMGCLDAQDTYLLFLVL